MSQNPEIEVEARGAPPSRVSVGIAVIAVVLITAILGFGVYGKFVAARSTPIPAQVRLVATASPTDDPTPDATDAATPIPTITVDATSDPTPSPVVYTPLPDTPDTVALPKIPVKIPGVTVVYYSITGVTNGDLIGAMTAGGPKLCDGEEALACFHGSYKWTWTGTGSTSVCSVLSVTWTPTYRISLPKWSGPAHVSAALVAWWKELFAHIVWHEEQHLAIARSYEAKFKAAIKGGPCNEVALSKSIAAVETKLDAAQAAFDASESGYSYPPY